MAAVATIFETRMEAARIAVEADLGQRLRTPGRTPSRLQAAMQYAVLGGGKRFRPFLVLESARVFGAPPSAAVCVASALEAVHCYSLVHDDLPAMDNDALRRGQPTVWTAFDEWTAILAGDALLTLAFQWLADPASPVPVVALPRVIAEFASAAGPEGMAGGQALDLAAGKLGVPAQLSLPEVLALQAMKTGALIRFACRSGPLLAEAGPTDLAAMTEYGEALGLAFQISDDLLDATGDVAIVGKAVAKDAAAGKATLVSLYGLDGARRELVATQERARDALRPYGRRAEALAGAIDFLGKRTH